MIKSVHFKNFKALIDTTLPLNRFTLIVGPNGSGKSTAMQGLHMAGNTHAFHFLDVVTASLRDVDDITVEIRVNWDISDSVVFSNSGWECEDGKFKNFGPDFNVGQLHGRVITNFREALTSFQIYSFDAQKLALPVELFPNATLYADGSNLAGVLESLRDKEPESFEALNEELGRWLPEFDRVLFDTPKKGYKSLLLRTRSGHRIEASDLSHGTLFALAFLTLAYLPNPPSILCFEEPERGIHPRLLREVRDAIYRLCYPEDHGEKRDPVQVIATTHSPYFLDLYKDHPEEIVIAHKDEKGVHFERLSDKPNIDEFLQDAPLGEVWYSGILGGVPNQP
ncbi:MAG TPA: AAA family ATPase [Pyrinomonadaceae bacterium]|nr:AAA family ATPase [Pyrinomonadaceae bacterium]